MIGAGKVTSPRGGSARVAYFTRGMVGLVSPERDVLSTGRTHQPRITPPHNLPAVRSSFVGREQETEEIKRELAMRRLLTLTGAGGSGKTRLALEVARTLVETYPDGVWLVELAPLSEEALVPKAVAEALEGVRASRRAHRRHSGRRLRRQAVAPGYGQL